MVNATGENTPLIKACIAISLTAGWRKWRAVRRPVPCRHHTVPKRVGETNLEQWRPRLERPSCAAISPRFQTQTDALARQRDSSRAHQEYYDHKISCSIATEFPSATRGRCFHERDRRFESVSLLRGAIFANLIPRPGRITGNRRFESSSLQRRIRRTPTRTGEVPSDLEVVRYWDLAATERTKLNDRTRRSAPRSATTRTVANPGAGRQERSEPSKRSL